MKKENDIQAELREWGSPLAGMSRDMPFVVPAGYFDQNVNNAFYTAASSGDIAVGNKEMPFAVPAGFFENLPQNIFDLAKAEDVAIGWPNHMPHTVPQDYFTTLPAAIAAQVAQPASRIVSFAPRTWMRQAVAAILILAVGLGGYQYAAHRHTTPEKQLAHVPQKSVQEYVHQNMNDVDVETVVANPVTNVAVTNAIKQLDQSDIDQYLEETGLKTEYNVN